MSFTCVVVPTFSNYLTLLDDHTSDTRVRIGGVPALPCKPDSLLHMFTVTDHIALDNR
jgi:hypothetical protein